ncbi:ATP-grasp domain-containing protein [Kitasatospora sp. NPDC008115]|uniref:ATP-grasp domain-containing protein n=1 Tax=Kitasatospora sp. NPDC008115 TaxID=3364022 RepID=UPI0036E9FE16
MPAPAFLLPAHPLDPRRIDPQFAWEARLLRDLGGEHHLVDHDALLAGDAHAAVRGVPAGRGAFWYRGWMLPSHRYAEFAAALSERGGLLLTTPPGYASAHELPGWYEVFEGATPPSVWLPLAGAGTGGGAGAGGVEPPGAERLASAVARLGGRGPAIVKDYVKSRKHEWDEACYIPELADLPAVERVVARFVELQAEHLAGGVVLRRFEEFTRVGWDTRGGPSGDGSDGPGDSDDSHDTHGSEGSDGSEGSSGSAGSDGIPDGRRRAVEARVWWLDGEPVLVGPHPDLPGCPAAPDLSLVRPLVRALGCRFVTTDLAERADGSGWRVVEVGDGQVSELPRGIDPSALLIALLAA